MPWTPRRKSAVFSVSLLGVCLGFFAAAGMSVNGILAPFVSGEEWAVERPLTRKTSALTVLVGAYEEGALHRVEGARVTVWRAALPEPVPVAEARTGANGRAIFELAHGPYFVGVERGNVSDREGVQLEESVRLGAYFVAPGEVHWRRVAHATLEEGGDTATLRVGALDRDRCRPEGGGTLCEALPHPGAEVEVLREGRRVAASFTGEGQAMRLPVATYTVRVTLENRTVETEVLLICDVHVDVAFEGGSGRVAHQGCPRQAVAIESAPGAAPGPSG